MPLFPWHQTSTGKLRSTSVTVAASNALAQAKANADYVCDGTADDVEIQAAIDALPDVSGVKAGVVELLAGIFGLAKTVRLNNRVWIKGSGNGVTIVGLNGGSNTTMFAGPASGNTAYCAITDIYFDGSKSNNTSSIGINCSNMSYLRLENLELINFATSGIVGKLELGYWNNILVAGANGIGYDLGDATGASANGAMIRVKAFQNGGGGYRYYNIIETPHWSCTAEGNTGIGWDIYSSARNTFNACWADDNTRAGIYLVIDDDSHFDDFGVSLNNTGSSPHNGEITIDGACNRTMFTRCNIIHTAAGAGNNGIYAEGAYTGTVLIVNNRLNVTGTPVNGGIPLAAGCIVRDNIGYVTLASGTGTIPSGSTSTVITHGLASSKIPAAADFTITPTGNPTNDPGNIWVDTITGAVATVNCRNNPGASGMAFSWKAELKF